QVFISTSIGIALFPEDGLDFGTLTRHADIAMYKCKDAGRDNYSFYTADMNLQNQARISMESDLRRALEQDQLELHYQPIVDMSSGKVVTVEALVRWRHPLKGLIMPQQFIPLAEETGLIIPLGEWVLKTACRDTAQLNIDGWPELKVSVNLSGRQFQSSELVDSVVKNLTETGLSVKNLQLEITESMIMHDVDEAIEI
ncbi:MAG: GGDEF domain-containing phosphodiesterase, partial [Motiliproteus sp.]|nr:GGDEF domain-containing phosphodiesterase [Motiliproteus sp.]